MDILVNQEDAILDIQIHRQDARNALNQQMYQQLAEALEQASATPAIRAVVLRGLPDVFCGGNDMQDFLAISKGMSGFAVERFMKALILCNKPLIAAVSGPAIGIGTTMLQFFDVVYASASALFKTPFVPLGLCPEMASSTELAKIIGIRKAKAMLLFGEAMAADEALSLGFINAIEAYPDQRALKEAKRICLLPPQAMKISKAMLLDHDRDRLLATIEQENRQLVECIRSDEAHEAVSAFLEKRTPTFQ